jgi:hypothetical protein
MLPPIISGMVWLCSTPAKRRSFLHFFHTTCLYTCPWRGKVGDRWFKVVVLTFKLLEHILAQTHAGPRLKRSRSEQGNGER